MRLQSLFFKSNKMCRSFNFCKSLICQLNYEDLFSTQLGETVLEHDTGCDYVGMEREHKPTCGEGRMIDGLREMANDSAAEETCEVDLKKINGENGWEVVKDDGTKQVYQKAPAHGGNQRDDFVVISIKIVKTLKLWPEAKDHCNATGGKLFAKLDGTKNQIDSLRRVVLSVCNLPVS